MALMSTSRAISGVIWAAIFVIALQFVSAPAFAHGAHTPHPGDVMAVAHKAAKSALQHKAASRPAQPVSQPTNLSALPERDGDIVGTFTGSCCGMGHGCGAAMLGFAAELPDFGAATRLAVLAAERQSGIDPDGLARPPRPLAL